MFMDASNIAAAIVQSGYMYDVGEIYYNKYFSAVKYELTILPFFNKNRIEVRILHLVFFFHVAYILSRTLYRGTPLCIFFLLLANVNGGNK